MNIHLLGVSETCACEAHHVCQSCQGQDERLEGVRDDLIRALEWFAKKTDSAAVVAEQWGQASQIPASEMRDWCNRANAAIEEARK